MNLSLRLNTARFVVVIAVLAAYHNSFTGAFVLDDFLSVVDNTSLRHFPTWFSPPPGSGIGGRPLANFTMGLNYAIGGTATWSYHVTNVALHMSAALLLFGLVRRTWPRIAAGQSPEDAMFVAFTSAVLWAVHPLPSGAVDYISQRTELLMAACYLLTLYACVRHIETPSPRWLALAIGVCACGMACKEVIVTAPVMALLLDRTLFAGSFAAAWRARRSLWIGLACTWLVLAALMLASPTTQRGVGFGLGVSPVDYALGECRALVKYLALAVWPDPLIFDYGRGVARGAGSVAPFVAIVLALLAATGLALWRRPVIGFAAAWFFVVLAPTSSFVPVVQQPFAESRMYLPLAGLVVAGVSVLHVMLGHRARVACYALALGGTLATVARNFDYADEVSLWTDTVVKQPNSARAHNNLSAALARAEDFSGAILQAQFALRLEPDFPEAHTNFGIAVLKAGHADRAVPEFETALRLRPDYAPSHSNLANALLRSGRVEEAIHHYAAAVRLEASDAKTRSAFSAALFAGGRLDEAVEQGAAAVRLDPSYAPAHYNYGHALQRTGHLAEAATEFEAALQIDSSLAPARNALEETRRTLSH